MPKWNYRDESKKISKSILKDKTTEELVESRDFIKGLLALKKADKLHKTYVNGTKKAIQYNEMDRVFVDYRFDGTATGRLSCAAYTAQKPMGVSFHTLPRDTNDNIRSLFVAPKGSVFMAADYSAMELRVLAHVAKEEKMQYAFNADADLHTYTAQLLFNKKEITKEERQIAKTVSFLIVYGGGAFNLAETMGIPMARAEGIIENYRNVYPGIFKYMDHVNSYIKRTGYAYTIFGRRRNLPDVYSKDRTVVNRALRQGLNFTIQSTASDILLCGLLGTNKVFTERSLSAKVVATVHDSIEIVCPKEEAFEVAEIVHDQLVNNPFMKSNFPIDFAVPFKIDLELGKSFGEVKPIIYEGSVPTNIDKVLNELR